MQIYDFCRRKQEMPPVLCNLGTYMPSFYAEAAEVIRERIQKRALLFTMKRKGHVFNLLSGKVYSHSIVEGGFEEMS